MVPISQPLIFLNLSPERWNQHTPPCLAKAVLENRAKALYIPHPQGVKDWYPVMVNFTNG